MVLSSFKDMLRHKRGFWYAFYTDVKADLTALSGGLVTWPITPQAGTDLELDAVTGKDIILKLTDAGGARSVIVKDSGDVTVFQVDSDGNVTATKFTGAIASSGSFTGDVINNAPATHNYAGASADWTLSASEKKARILSATNANAGCAIIAPEEYREYIVKNGTGQTLTIKKAAGTGVSILNGDTEIVYYDGTDYAKVAI